MKADPEQRAVQLGEYIAAHNATVRAAAAAVGCTPLLGTNRVRSWMEMCTAYFPVCLP